MSKILLSIMAAAIAMLPMSFGHATATTSGSVVIGQINPHTGKARLDERLLKRRFADGGVIRHFVAMPFHDGYNLLRIGKDAQGHCRTETMRLTRSNLELKFEALRWITTCSSSTCDDNNEDLEDFDFGGSDTDDYENQNSLNFAMCSPNHDKTGCDCIGQNGTSSCNFGIDVSGVGLETVLFGY
jgi:hypothetical protein